MKFYYPQLILVSTCTVQPLILATYEIRYCIIWCYNHWYTKFGCWSSLMTQLATGYHSGHGWFGIGTEWVVLRQSSWMNGREQVLFAISVLRLLCGHQCSQGVYIYFCLDAFTHHFLSRLEILTFFIVHNFLASHCSSFF